MFRNINLQLNGEDNLSWEHIDSYLRLPVFTDYITHV